MPLAFGYPSAVPCPPTIAVIQVPACPLGFPIQKLSGGHRAETSGGAVSGLIVVAAPPPGFGWGREGHEVIALIAEENMTPAALERAKAILGGSSLEEVASWADEYRHNHRET